ncbi:MAG: hypothetical protein QF464_09700 [Myxococcota bacterium]|jgi:hypothetical protein|nr:hypothetical protein [Myxococcota bacterium]
MALFSRQHLADPAVRFLVAGAAVLIAGFFADAQQAPVQPAAWEIEVHEAHAAFEARLGRLPSPEEARALTEILVDAEALVREARALDLGRDDHIVRGRLAQKRRALARETAAGLADDAPGGTEPLGEVGPSVTRFGFEHVFFSRHQGVEATARRVEAAQEGLRQGSTADTLGDPFIRGRRFEGLDTEEVARIFGSAFAQRLADLPTGAWSTVDSEYGAHLVRLDDRTEAPRTESAARAARVDDAARGHAAERALIDSLRARIPIHRESARREAP